MSKQRDLKSVIGERLKELRDSLAYKQEKMAALLAISRNSYGKKEIGETYPGYSVMHKLGSSFDVSLDWLICGKGPMFLKEKGPAQRNGQTGANPGEARDLSPEHRELIESMERQPLLHYEIMAHFHRFKKENREMFESES